MSEGTELREKVYQLCGHITGEVVPVWDFLHSLVSDYEALQQQLTEKDAVIGRLRSRATYFIAQFENDWDLGHISIESKRAMNELDAELDSQ